MQREPAVDLVGPATSVVEETDDEKATEIVDPAEASDRVREHPHTGGAALVPIGAGALLTAAGLPVRRAIR